MEFKLSYPTICVDFYSDLMNCLVKINVDEVTKFSDSVLFFFSPLLLFLLDTQLADLQ